MLIFNITYVANINSESACYVGQWFPTFCLWHPIQHHITGDLISVDVSCKTFSQKVNILFRLLAFSGLKRLKYSLIPPSHCVSIL